MASSSAWSRTRTPTSTCSSPASRPMTASWGARTASANVIFTDGTMDTVDVNVRDSERANNTSFSSGAVVNTWCTYTVNSSGVYTLREVVDNGYDLDNNKVGQSRYVDDHNYGNPAAANFEETFAEINDTHVSLPGRDLNDNGVQNGRNASTDLQYYDILDNGTANTTGANSTGDYVRVYGNDDSVYINVELEDVTVSGSGRYMIIDDVETVTTGIENTDLRVYTNSEVRNGAASTTYAGISSGVYTLYDDDAYVIAAIVVGEDVGSTTEFAYVTSSRVTNETYLGNDEWSWSREVAINGQLTEITYVDDQLDEIGVTAATGNMQRGEWYEIRYDANGNVRRADLIPTEEHPSGYAATVAAAVGPDRERRAHGPAGG